MDETSNTETTIQTNTDSVSPSTGEVVVEPVAVPVEPEVANLPVIQVATEFSQPEGATKNSIESASTEILKYPRGNENGCTLSGAPESSQPEAGTNRNTQSSEPAPETPAPQIIERVVEKEVIKEVIKEVPVDRVVEKIVEKQVEPTDASLRAYLANFLRRVGPKGRAMQHERAQKKRESALALFDTHKEVTQKLLRDTLKLRHSDANRVLTELRDQGKIVMHEGGGNNHHGGRGTYYTRS